MSQRNGIGYGHGLSEAFEVGDEQTRREVFGVLFPIIQMATREFGMGWGKEMEEAAVMGEQEEQQMREKRLQDRARVIATVIDNRRPQAGSSDKNQGAPQISLAIGESDENVDVDGSELEEVRFISREKKRKRPMQVIDLTDE